MTRFARSKALLCAVLSIGAAVGCARAKANPDIDIDISINSPMAPTPSGGVVKSLRILPRDTTEKRRVIEGECRAEVLLSVEVIGEGNFSRDVTWSWAPTSNGTSVVETGQTNARFWAKDPGVYTVRSRSDMTPSVYDEIRITVEGDCGSGTTPGPGAATVDLKVNNSDGPITVQANATVALSWALTNVSHCNPSWMSGMVSGSGGAMTVTVTRDTRYSLPCVGLNGQTVTDFVDVRVTSSPPPEATLTVSPSILEFQLPGSGCTATGPQAITISANNDITIESANTSMASVSVGNLGAGNNRQVFVTAVGNASGVTNVVVRAGGRTATVAIRLNACQVQLTCSTNVAYRRSDGSSSFTVGVNQTVGYSLIQQSGWPSHCGVIGLTDSPDKITFIANGAIYEVCSGGLCNWYYEGKSGGVKGVAPGSAQGITQGIIMENGRWTLNVPARFSATWSVVSTLADTLGLKMPESNQKWVTDPRFPGKKICLTWQCQ